MSRILTGLGRMEQQLGGPSQAEVGREALTVPMIAGRAGVTPSTIYRRWGDLAELLADVAVEHLRPAGAPADTGAVDTDLEVWVEQYMEEMSSEVGRALLRDILGNASEAGQSLQCCSFTGEQLQVIADRAVARGERSFEVDDALDQVIAPIMYRILFFGGPVTRLLPRAAGAVLARSTTRSLATAAARFGGDGALAHIRSPRRVGPG